MMQVLEAITKAAFVPPSLLNPECPAARADRAAGAGPQARGPLPDRDGDARRAAPRLVDRPRLLGGLGGPPVAPPVPRRSWSARGMHVEVPPDFLELMGRWRAPPPSPPRCPMAAHAATSSKGQAVNASERIETAAAEPDEERPRRSRRDHPGRRGALAGRGRRPARLLHGAAPRLHSGDSLRAVRRRRPARRQVDGPGDPGAHRGPGRRPATRASS